MKALKKLMIALITTICSINAYAYDFEVDGIYYKWLSQEQKTVAVSPRLSGFGESYSGKVEIPTRVTFADTEYVVTAIDEFAFYECSLLEEVVIPSSVKYVNGFRHSSVSKVAIAEGVKGIDNLAFFNCDNLATIEIPKGMISIGNNAFGDCDNLKEVLIDEGLETIGDNAFEKCTSLETLSLPSTFYRVGKYAFHNSGIKKIVFTGEKSVGIGDLAFYNTKLTDAEMSNVSDVGNMAFYGTLLKETVFGDNLRTIGEMAFYGTPLKTIVFGSGVKSIGKYAFYMTDIETVDLSKAEGLQSVEYAFTECRRLLSVKLPQCLEDIGDEAFKNCISLKKLEFPQSLVSIGKAAFEGCSQLQISELPVSLKNVHGGAFNGCLKIESLDFPPYVWFHMWEYESIVSGCINLKSVKLPGIPLPMYPIFNGVNLETVSAVYGFDNNVPENIGELFNDQTYGKAILKVPVGTVELYRNTWPWTQFINIEEDSSLEMVGVDNVQKDNNGVIWYAEGKIRHNIATDADIEIFDIDGKSVLRCESVAHSIDISELPLGVYIIKANYGYKTIEEKIVIK